MIQEYLLLHHPLPHLASGGGGSRGGVGGLLLPLFLFSPHHPTPGESGVEGSAGVGVLHEPSTATSLGRYYSTPDNVTHESDGRVKVGEGEGEGQGERERYTGLVLLRMGGRGDGAFIGGFVGDGALMRLMGYDDMVMAEVTDERVQ